MFKFADDWEVPEKCVVVVCDFRHIYKLNFSVDFFYFLLTQSHDTNTYVDIGYLHSANTLLIQPINRE